MNNHQTVVQKILSTKSVLIRIINKNKGNVLKIPRHYNLAASDYTISYNNNELYIIPSIGGISATMNDNVLLVEDKLSNTSSMNTDRNFKDKVMITWLELLYFQIQTIIKYYDK